MRKDMKGKKSEEGKQDNFVEKLIAVNRVSKSTKGGRTISFAAIMVVGDRCGRVGFALGKANDVSEAIKKATQKARKEMKPVTLKRIVSATSDSVNVTIPHEVEGKFKSAKVFMRPAAPGTGVIAGGCVRAICDAAGITDILSKSIGSNNMNNVIKATLEGLGNLMSSAKVAQNRNKSVKEMWG